MTRRFLIRALRWCKRQGIRVKRVLTDNRLRREHALVPVGERQYLVKYPTAAPESVAWLVGTEVKYGGLQTRVPRNRLHR